MTVSKNKTNSFIMVAALCFFTLFIGAQSLDWQGYGNMSSSNLTTIWGFINSNVQLIASAATRPQFCTNFSNYLNKEYDPAWNTFVSRTKAGTDMILYGYSFRDHWMWYNGYNFSGNTYTFIIWKDYNCQVWEDISGGNQVGTLASAGITAALVGVNTVNPNTDIWGKTKKFMDNLVKQTGFSGDDKAFTIIAAEDYSISSFFARVCLANAKAYFYKTSVQFLFSSGSEWGYFMVLQMR